MFADIPDAKVRHFATEARCLTANVLSRMVEPKRLALMAALLQNQIARTLDDLADMFVRQLQRMHARAQDALRLYQLEKTQQTDALIALLREAVLTCRGEGSGE